MRLRRCSIAAGVLLRHGWPSTSPTPPSLLPSISGLHKLHPRGRERSILVPSLKMEKRGKREGVTLPRSSLLPWGSSGVLARRRRTKEPSSPESSPPQEVLPCCVIDFTDPIVVLLQFCRVKNGIRDGEVKLCSSYVVTQGFLSDEADSSVATLGMTIPHEGIEALSRCP
nr:uncharacterized protein LOC109153635 isoform X3 [Ipomoea trifida]